MLINNNIFSKTLRAVKILALSALTLLPVGCINDLLDDGIRPNGDGTFGPINLEIAFDSEINDTKTRGTFDTNNFKMTSSWAAIFDVATGNVIAMVDTLYNFNDGNFSAGTDHTAGAGEQYKVEFKNFIFNDANNEVYIAGVANYENIFVIDAHGNETTLINALKDVTNIIEYKNIAVNTASAEKALNGENRPLIAGFWGDNHGNFTVNLSGKVYTNEPNSSSGSTANPIVQLYDKSTYKITEANINAIANGKIHLRRLYSHLNINVKVNTSDNFKFSNPRVKVYNMPQYTFLQEHKTVENPQAYTNETWPAATHTAADLYGTRLDTEVISANNTAYNNTKDAAFIMNDEDKFTVSTSGNTTTIKFGYWHYETKGWAMPSVASANDRERMHGNSGVYSSLCPSAEDDFNNAAPYFVITADVESGTYKGAADFIIHEGNCCQADGNAAKDAATAAKDFSTFRNVNYTYNVEINGINNIITKVTAEDLSGDFYHGTGGDLWASEPKMMKVAKDGNTYDITFPGKLFWCITEDDDKNYYGVPMDQDWKFSERYPSYPRNVTEYTGRTRADSFYDNITIDGLPLAEIGNIDPDRTFTLKFGEASGAGKLYLCGVQTSPDGMVTLYTVYCFNQNGDLLDSPVIQMPYAPATGALVMGIDDHTLRWKAIKGAQSYTVKLETSNGMGGYFVTLDADGTEISDKAFLTALGSTADPINVKLNKINIAGDDYFEFRIRYSNKAKAMLNFLQSQDQANVTFSVTANAGDETSDPGTISRTIINPVWDFNATEWQNGVSKLQIDNSAISGAFAANQTLEVNGLTMYTGNSNKMTYEKNGNYYNFRPNGIGSTSNRGFRFNALSSGKLSVWTSSTSASSSNLKQKRYVKIYTNSDGELQASEDATETAPGTLTECKTNLSFNVNGKDPGGANVWIYNSADIKFYKIKLTPEDR